jgi:hypothetical protein
LIGISRFPIFSDYTTFASSIKEVDGRKAKKALSNYLLYPMLLSVPGFRGTVRFIMRNMQHPQGKPPTGASLAYIPPVSTSKRLSAGLDSIGNRL